MEGPASARIPAAVVAFSDGVVITGPGSLGVVLIVLVSVVSEELLFRGVLLRTQAPAGTLEPVVLTSLLAGTEYMVRHSFLSTIAGWRLST
ncbi:MAG: hypothetical protein H0U04_15540 [Rubrobacter sp.]|jgi:membrane protease YdiL (CAAX protease family)|nr:hypothetical protein [Rubrobacter sp.]